MSGTTHTTAAALLSARWTPSTEPGVILADLGPERGAVGLAAIDPHRALDLSDADAAALAGHVADAHNLSEGVRTALRNLINYLIESRLFEEVEASCNCDGLVARAYRALGQPFPPELVQYFGADGDDDWEDNEAEDDAEAKE